jgi:hypothetical protein
MFGARITAETRAALEAEAERTGRSKSQVAEQWLDQARALNSLGPAAPAISDMIGVMLRFAAEVVMHEGDPAKPGDAQEILRCGLAKIAENVIPLATTELSAAHSATRYAALNAAEAIASDSPNPRYQQFRIWLLDLAHNRLWGDDPEWRRAGDEFDEFVRTSKGLLADDQQRRLAGQIEIVLGHMILEATAASAAGEARENAELRADLILKMTGWESGA